MKKYIVAGLVFVSVLSFGLAVRSASAEGITLKQLVELFINLGIIGPDKAAAARAAVSGGTVTVPPTATTATTTTAATSTKTGAESVAVSVLSKSIYKISSSGQNTSVKDTVISNFAISIAAVDPGGPDGSAEDIYFAKNSFEFSVLKNGAWLGGASALGTVAYDIPSSGVTTSGMPSGFLFVLRKNNMVTIPVTITYAPTSASSASYAVSLNSFSYGVKDDATGVISYKGVIWNTDEQVSKGFITSSVSAEGPSGSASNPSVSVSAQSKDGTYPIGGNMSVKYGVSSAPNGAYLALSLANGPTPIAIKTFAVSNTSSSFDYTIPTSGCPSDYCYDLKPGTYNVQAILFDRQPCGAMAYCPDGGGKAIATAVSGSIAITSPATYTKSAYHSADLNKDWKIGDDELSSFLALYNYRNGSVRTGEYSVGTTARASDPIYVPGPGSHAGVTHSADSDKDWKISLTELTRVIELKNATGGYKVQAGTEDGYAPVTKPVASVDPAITPSVQSVDSGKGVQFSMTIPSNTVRAMLYISCPSGITGIFKADGDCNKYFDVTDMANRSIPFAFVPQNSTAKPLVVVPNFYVYTSDNPNYARGVSGSITVQAGVTSTPVSACTDSDGGINLDVAGLTDGRVNGLGSYFNDASVSANGSQCSGTSCVAVAEGYCQNGQVTNYLYQCPSGYSVNGACATAPVTTPAASADPTIAANSQIVNSGDTVTLNFTYPSNTVRAMLYISCPSGAGIGGAKGSITDCNSYADVTNYKYAMFQLINTTASPINVVPNYYIYTSDNPNYARGVSSSVTVQGGVTSTPVPVPTSDPAPVASIRVTSPNGGETMSLGQSYTITWTSSNIPSNLTAAYILLTDANGSDIYYINQRVMIADGSYIWTVGQNSTLGPGTYKVKMAVYNTNTGTFEPYDLSDGAFTITSPASSASVYFGADQLMSLIKALR